MISRARGNPVYAEVMEKGSLTFSLYFSAFSNMRGMRLSGCISCLSPSPGGYHDTATTPEMSHEKRPIV